MIDTLVILIIVFLTLTFVWRQIIHPKPKLTHAESDRLHNDDVCCIDVRDFITSHRDPVEKAVNIPLAYLKRELKQKEDLWDKDKDILIVCDDRRTAVMASRMLTKKTQGTIYYTTC